MTDQIPQNLVVTFDAEGRAIETWVPITGAALVQWQADQAAAQTAAVQTAVNTANIKTELQGQMVAALAIADALDTNTATAAQQRAGLSACLRGLVRLTKVVYRDLATPA